MAKLSPRILKLTLLLPLAACARSSGETAPAGGSLAAASPEPSPTPEERQLAEGRRIGRQIVVAFRPGDSAKARARVAKDHGATEVQELADDLYLFELPEGRDVPATTAAIAKMRGVKSAKPNLRTRVMESSAGGDGAQRTRKLEK